MGDGTHSYSYTDILLGEQAEVIAEGALRVEKLTCPKCEVLMGFDADKNFYLCAVCRGEFWPPEESNFRDIQELWKDEQRYKRAMSKPGGGKKAGRKREEKKKILNLRISDT